MHESFSHLPPQMDVPIECSQCGYMTSLLASEANPDTGSLPEACDCDAAFKVYVSDAGPYAGLLEMLLDSLERDPTEAEMWAEAMRDDLREE